MTVFDKNVDLLVIGSGAAGLSAAAVAAHYRRSVMVLEKSNWIGGTSATSGGGVWIPNSPNSPEPDSSEDAQAYLRALVGDTVNEECIAAFIEGAPAMLEWFSQHSDLSFVSVPYPDYHQEAPGSRTGWRTHFPMDFDGKRLGPLVDKIREASPAASFLGLINWTLPETHALLHRTPGWHWVFIKMLWRYASDVSQRLRSRRDRHLTLGNAIIGSLVHVLEENGTSIDLESSVTKLILTGSGEVTGAEVRLRGQKIMLKTGSILFATGGFERNSDLRAKYLPAAGQNPEMSGAQESNTGDALGLVAHLNPKLLNMNSAWWAPVFKVEGEYRARLCAFERAFPGCIMLNREGRRYMNEAASYHVAAQKMIAEHEKSHNTAPSWIIFDTTFRRKYPMGPLLPIPLFMHPKAIRSSVVSAGSLEELARRTGLPIDALQETVERFNRFASTGNDTDFGRGATEYERYYGDSRVSPNPTLAPISRAPFFAMQLHVGDIGTNGGFATNANAEILDHSNKTIKNLYAAGNCSASVMGHCYPAAGGTLGPALTFGFIAAHHALGIKR